MKTQKHVRLP